MEIKSTVPLFSLSCLPHCFAFILVFEPAKNKHLQLIHIEKWLERNLAKWKYLHLVVKLWFSLFFSLSLKYWLNNTLKLGTKRACLCVNLLYHLISEVKLYFLCNTSIALGAAGTVALFPPFCLMQTSHCNVWFLVYRGPIFPFLYCHNWVLNIIFT